jgi:hypothetical protein
MRDSTTRSSASRTPRSGGWGWPSSGHRQPAASTPIPGPALSYYKRLAPTVAAPEKEDAFFDGMDTSLAGLYRTLGREAPPAADRLLAAISREIEAAVEAFSITNPSAAAAALARALDATRTASRELGEDTDVAHTLELKAQQIADAIHAALGIRLTAIAQRVGTPESTGPFAAGPPPMGPVVPGQSFEVRATFTHRGTERSGRWPWRSSTTTAWPTGTSRRR